MKEDYSWSKKCLTPCYIIEEKKLLKNIETLKNFSNESNVHILLALKGFANWKIFDKIAPSFDTATCSSINEFKLANEYLPAKPHVYFVAYDDNDFDFLCKNSAHVTFNSVSQYQHFSSQSKQYPDTHFGIRINPEVRYIKTDLYNPCDKNSRLGVRKQELDAFLNRYGGMPEGLDGFHFHALCEDDGSQFILLIEKIQSDFAEYLTQIQWVNLGGGHLITKKGYLTKKVTMAILSFKKKYPNLKIIIEPSSAFAWDIGVLSSQVIDIVKGKKYDTAIVNCSFTCHMPDCLEMPYKPNIIHISSNPGQRVPSNPSEKRWIGAIGGLSCLAGDVIKEFKLENSPQKGDTIIFRNMIHYTMVKTTQFNGIQHPDIIFMKKNGELITLKSFDYNDYKNQF